MKTITFKCEAPLAKKLKNEPSRNRRFNTKSEIIRTVLDLYLNDHVVKRAVHEAMKRKYSDLIDMEDL